jgi:hypothetical protein
MFGFEFDFELEKVQGIDILQEQSGGKSGSWGVLMRRVGLSPE